MKHFVLFISAFFICFVAIADTITLNWGVDNQSYTTTTCEIGNDVLLPTAPTKRGHVFRGWQEEHFDRGTFVDWNEVPNNYNGYKTDIYYSSIPRIGDFIIIEDSSNYTGNYDSPINISATGSRSVTIGNQTKSFGATAESGKTTIIYNGITFYAYCDYTNKLHIQVGNNKVVYNNRVVQNAEIYSGSPSPPIKIIVYYSTVDDFVGSWRFKYDGVWETDGKNGWKPVEQIVSE